MRFRVTQVMDAIEQRLTTDVVAAQAVVDLGEVVRHADLDGGRPANLVRIGMIVDALSRYLVDGGALLYGVVERSLLSEAAFTSKEKMVLGRWVDDGLIEVVDPAGGAAAERAIEVADLTGLPLIALRRYEGLADRFPWLDEGQRGDGVPGRVLYVTPGNGLATLSPAASAQTTVEGSGPASGPQRSAARAIGRVRVPTVPPAQEPVPSTAPATQVPEPVAGEQAPAQPAGTEQAPAQPAGSSPVAAFTGGGAGESGLVRVSRHRYLGGAANPAHRAVLTRQWRCQEVDCPAFGAHRRIGQPVPRMRADQPTCPRHGHVLTDDGSRPPAYVVSIVVDDLPRCRLVVGEGAPMGVGSAEDDPDVFSLRPWLHRSAAAWVDRLHVLLEATGDGLRVTDCSSHGTVVWQRGHPHERGEAQPMRHASYTLRNWDSLELYTGIELVPASGQPHGASARAEPASILIDAPTAAHRQVGGGRTGDSGTGTAPAGAAGARSGEPGAGNGTTARATVAVDR